MSGAVLGATAIARESLLSAADAPLPTAAVSDVSVQLI